MTKLEPFQRMVSSQYAWYNILMNFARSRAQDLGLTNLIRPLQRRNCPLCGHSFDEHSLPVPFVERLGVDHLDFCSPCLKVALFGEGDPNASEDDIVSYIRSLAKLLGRAPHQGFGCGTSDLQAVDDECRKEVLRLLMHKPSVKRAKELFGTWQNALFIAGVKEKKLTHLVTI